MSNILIKHEPKIVRINDYVKVRIIQMPRQKTGESIVPSYVNQLRNVIERHGLLAYGETATYISFVQAKRSFIVKTNAGKIYLLTIFLSENVSWIYEVRRSLGQPPCCARAHATSQGLPDKKLERAYQAKYNAFLSANMLPCQKHFLDNLDDPYHYIQGVSKHNVLKLHEHEISDTTKITYRLLIRLIQGETPFSAQIPRNEAREMYEAEQQHYRVTQLSDISNIIKDCENILADIEERKTHVDEQDVDLAALEAIAKSVTGSMDALNNLARDIQTGTASSANSSRLYKNMEVIKVIQRQIQSVQFSMLVI